MKGIVIKSTGSFYDVTDETGKIYSCKIRGQLRLKTFEATNPIVVGDKVEIEIEIRSENSATIINLLERKNYIQRKSVNLSKQRHIIAANIDRAWVIATPLQPKTSTGFIDRFLATAEAYSIKGGVIFSKSDLYDDKTWQSIRSLKELYKSIGYESIIITAFDEKDISSLEEMLRGRVNLFSGHSGVGKSTIINLLSRFYETRPNKAVGQVNKGEITIDNKNISEYKLEELRKNTGVVLQDVHLFNDSIYNNIALHNPNISLAQIMDAAKQIGLHDFISSLPGAYNYVVKERGITLSAGQRQLIAFIRAFVYNPKIFILDEATSTIDTQTEQLIQKALEKISKGRTSIIIAHRLATIKNTNKIIVFDKGEIVEQGTQTELLNLNGQFKRLYELQFEDVV